MNRDLLCTKYRWENGDLVHAVLPTESMCVYASAGIVPTSKLTAVTETQESTAGDRAVQPQPPREEGGGATTADGSQLLNQRQLYSNQDPALQSTGPLCMAG